MTEKRLTLCLDFDGVLHSYTSGWQGAETVADPPVDGAIEFLLKAVRYFDVAIYSSRSHQEGRIVAMRDALHRWMVEDNVPPAMAHGLLNGIDTFPFKYPAPITFPLEKPAAHVTLDDRAWRFRGEWPRMDDLLAFKPWNKE